MPIGAFCRYCDKSAGARMRTKRCTWRVKDNSRKERYFLDLTTDPLSSVNVLFNRFKHRYGEFLSNNLSLTSLESCFFSFKGTTCLDGIDAFVS